MSSTRKIVGFVGFTASSFSNISGQYQHRIKLRNIETPEQVSECSAIVCDIHNGVSPERESVIEYFNLTEDDLKGKSVGLTKGPDELDKFICYVEGLKVVESKIIKGNFV